MIFYRRPSQVYAISFDLDDTLYDNKPVIYAAEEGLFRFISDRVAALQAFDWSGWEQVWRKEKRRQLVLQPELADDVSALRKRVIYQVSLDHGASRAEALQLSSEGFHYFLQLRNQVAVPQHSLDLLTRLAEKLPLVAITNGNVDIEAIGLAGYFRFTLAAGGGLRRKPAPDLFIEAERRLSMRKAQLLHVGDNLHTDVGGAVKRGWQAVWFNPDRRCVRSASGKRHPPGHLPTLELHDLACLQHLI
jgi:putative hydrolase of the HAD superfamily